MKLYVQDYLQISGFHIRGHIIASWHNCHYPRLHEYQHVIQYLNAGIKLA